MYYAGYIWFPRWLYSVSYKNKLGTEITLC